MGAQARAGAGRNGAAVATQGIEHSRRGELSFACTAFIEEAEAFYAERFLIPGAVGGRESRPRAAVMLTSLIWRTHSILTAGLIFHPRQMLHEGAAQNAPGAGRATGNDSGAGHRGRGRAGARASGFDLRHGPAHLSLGQMVGLAHP